jgi:CheY-like chemotaxis protein/DNA-directed RNA polymerase subunit RPC12/RpoP
MEVLCEHCQYKINIPDGKIPPGKSARVACPQCKRKVVVSAPAEAEAPQAVLEEGAFEDFFSFSEDDEEGGEAEVRKPFDFVEEEGRTALLCESDPDILKKVRQVLEVLEYNTTVPRDGRDALKKMRYHAYDVVIINEIFDTQDPDINGVLIYLERLNMEERRNIFVTLLSSRFRTMDQMAAFQKSVNIVVNLNNIQDFDKILRRSLADSDLFYRVFRECLPQ